MIPFFRRIRKRLLPGGAASRYLLYAIGEIALVVLGILIALQINNWNEARKDKIIEKEILRNLAQCLDTNVKLLEEQIDLNKRSDDASEIILHALENRLPYHDSLSAYLGYASNVDNSGDIFSYYAYEVLKNTGMEIIRNQALKNEIVLLFEETFAIPRNRMDRVGETYADHVAFRQEHFVRLWGYDFEPIDYEGLLNDKKVHSWFRAIAQNRGWINQSLGETLAETQRVLKMVKSELKE